MRAAAATDRTRHAGQWARVGRRPALLALTTVPVLLEVVLTHWRGLPSATALSPQVTAPEPFGTFHDIRWLLVYADSWLTLALETALWFVVRSAWLLLVIRAAWPEESEPPAVWRALRVIVPAVLVTALLMAPWAALLFGLAIVSVSWLFFAAVPSALLVALVIHAAPVESDWWRRTPCLRTVGLVALVFLALTVEGAFLVTAPLWQAVLIAIGSGVVNAFAWAAIVHLLVARPVSRAFVPVAPIGIAMLVGAIIVGIASGLGGSSVRYRAGAGGAYTRAARSPVMLVTGFGSSWNGSAQTPIAPGIDTYRFSYRGLGPGRRPLAYDRTDTRASIPVLVGRLRQQVVALRRASGQPVALVAESEGSVIAKAYLAGDASAPVQHLVLLSPIIHPGRVYAPPHDDDGWGVGGTATLRVLGGALHAFSVINVSTDTPLLRSFIDGAPTVRDLIGCPLPGVHQQVLFPVADAVAAPHPAFVQIPFHAVPAFHGGLLQTTAVRHTIARALDGADPTPDPLLQWTVRLVQRAASAWQVPELPFGLVHGWSSVPSQPTCLQMRAAAHAWLTSSAP